MMKQACLLSPGSCNISDDVELGTAFSIMQFDPSGVMHDVHGAINDVLQNGFETPATYCNFLRGEHYHFIKHSKGEVLSLPLVE